MVEATLELPSGAKYGIGRAPNGQGVYVTSGAIQRIRGLAGKDGGSFVVGANALIDNSRPNPPWKLERNAICSVRENATHNPGYQNVLVIVPSANGGAEALDFLVGWNEEGRQCKIAGEAALEIVRKVGRSGNYVFRIVLECCNGDRAYAYKAFAASQVGDRLERGQEMQATGRLLLARAR
ncbi:MAG: hypothetical protein BWY43_00526 [candidate division WS2 bacterium ADurb.Bin280]|uniref:Uncharacterized protein n=1 Tax=candidate division WS2 bacterium ADurb.Bin280 TaxID=1852829 RepID=A0A1V5SD58_9BACT|nr:MAG: hypothetical protein BWY43_00526 [candidate division WS2 bacterium ADurb.Bin280]